MKTGKTRRQTGSRRLLTTFAWIAALALILGILVPAVLMGLQHLALRRTRNVYPPPGEVFVVDGRAMHLFCEGASEPGGPTVVIDAGNASFALDWVDIQRRLSSRYRICAYDRAGYGWSAPRPGPRDADHAVEELRMLLMAAGEDEPIILVGHALGGVHARLYAARYRDDVAGLVLVDPATDYAHSEAFAAQQRETMGFYEVRRFLVGSGLLRIIGPLVDRGAAAATARALPEDVQAAYLELLLDPAYYETALAELQMLQTSVRQANAALDGETPLGDMPLVVLTAAMRSPDGATPYSTELVPAVPDAVAAQGTLARLSSRGERRMLGRSGHLVQLDAPEAVVAAVDDVYATAMVGIDVR